MKNLSKRKILNEALRRDFGLFIHRCFQEVSGGEQYQHNWHIDAIAHASEQCRRREVTRQIISLPPRSLKSIVVSVALPAWILGHDPSAKIISVSYTSGLAGDFCRKCRSIMSSSWYAEVFPNTRINPDKNTELHFETTKGGYRYATSVGGTLTGMGAGYIIIDDPLKTEDGESEAARRNVKHWFDNTLYSRLNDKRTDVIMIVGQRVHEDDLIGHVLEKETWKHLRLPAIAEVPHDIALGKGRVRHREVGDLLHPEREPEEVLKRMKANMGPRAFSAQYQQEPVPPEGALIRLADFRYYENIKFRYATVQSWDTATKATELSDYSVCTTWSMHEKKFYLRDVFRERLAYPELRSKVIEHALKWRAGLILVEDSANGPALEADIYGMRIVNLANIELCRPDGDKIVRMARQCARIADGSVLLPKDAEWLKTFLDECRAFPHGKNDDQVDSMSQFLNWRYEYNQNRVRVRQQ